MDATERHNFVPEKTDEGVVLYDSRTEQHFTLEEFCSLVEESLAEAFPDAELVSCTQLAPESAQFACRVGGYELNKQEAFLVAQKAAYDVAERFRLAIGLFVTQLNGWSFVLEIV